MRGWRPGREASCAGARDALGCLRLDHQADAKRSRIGLRGTSHKGGLASREERDAGQDRALSPSRKSSPPEFTEAEAIERAKRGDAAAFARLYELHKRRVYSLCLRMTYNSTEAEDLTQEVFMQLFRKLHTFRGESAFSTWLHRLAVNSVLMHLRKKGLVAVSLEETTETEEGETPKKEVGGPDNLLAGSIDRVNLERAIERLPPGYKAVFILHDIEGFEHNEIAERMGCSVGNSKSQLHKARMKLREYLHEERKKRLAKETKSASLSS